MQARKERQRRENLGDVMQKQEKPLKNSAHRTISTSSAVQDSTARITYCTIRKKLLG